MLDSSNPADYLSGLEKRLEATRNLHQSIIEQLTASLKLNPNLCSPFRIHLTPIQLGLMRESLVVYNRTPTHIVIGADVWPRLISMVEVGVYVEFDALDHECVTGKVGMFNGIPIISGSFFYKEPWYNLDKNMIAFVHVNDAAKVSNIVAARI